MPEHIIHRESSIEMTLMKRASSTAFASYRAIVIEKPLWQGAGRAFASRLYSASSSFGFSYSSEVSPKERGELLTTEMER